MSIRAEYLGYVFDVKNVHPWDDGRRIEATAMYAVAQAVLAQASFLDNWDDSKSYMVGLHVATNQVVEVSYRGQSGGFFQLIADSTLETEPTPFAFNTRRLSSFARGAMPMYSP